MRRKFFDFIQWLPYRLFCGAECWTVHCIIYSKSGSKVRRLNSEFRIYKRLSRHINDLDSIAPELTREMMADFQLAMNMPADGCEILNVERVW